MLDIRTDQLVSLTSWNRISTFDRLIEVLLHDDLSFDPLSFFRKVLNESRVTLKPRELLLGLRLGRLRFSCLVSQHIFIVLSIIIADLVSNTSMPISVLLFDLDIGLDSALDRN